jgi:hypothetical protein
MSLIEKLPGMTDDDVGNLLANARRLAETGSDKQRTAAAEILPALEAAAEGRHAARLEAAASRKPVRVAKPKVPKAAKTVTA